MMIMGKIEELLTKIEVADKIKVLEIIESIAEYITLVSKRNMAVHIYCTRNEFDDKKVENKYNSCVEQIQELNKISKVALGEQIYDKSYDRVEVEAFILQLSGEIFDNRQL